ncbi:MAG TPA: nuclear transport factor 2 family protein [Thermoanaerobaculia bacterium]|nr:nuclear transport factor 2 family protein [Thermoanaerobaculia bacterium]
MSEDAEAQVLDAVHAWDQAMVQNDAEAIGRYMSDDWTIIGPDGSIGGKERFLGLIEAGTLTHDVMESHDLTIRIYGDTAVVTGRGISGGIYQGERFYLVERTSCVFVHQPDGWKCVLTHLSQLVDDSSSSRI